MKTKEDKKALRVAARRRGRDTAAAEIRRQRETAEGESLKERKDEAQ